MKRGPSRPPRRYLATLVCLICMSLTCTMSLFAFYHVVPGAISYVGPRITKWVVSPRGGLGLLRNALLTVGPRLWIVEASTGGLPRHAMRLIVDTSWDLEFSYLLETMRARDFAISSSSVSPAKSAAAVPPTTRTLFRTGVRPFAPFVVDIGAFDGVIASNSHNLLQLGWSGLLVEPHPEHFQLAVNSKRGLIRKVGGSGRGAAGANDRPQQQGQQRIEFAQVALLTKHDMDTKASGRLSYTPTYPEWQAG